MRKSKENGRNKVFICISGRLHIDSLIFVKTAGKALVRDARIPQSLILSNFKLVGSEAAQLRLSHAFSGLGPYESFHRKLLFINDVGSSSNSNSIFFVIISLPSICDSYACIVILQKLPAALRLNHGLELAIPRFCPPNNITCHNRDSRSQFNSICNVISIHELIFS